VARSTCLTHEGRRCGGSSPYNGARPQTRGSGGSLEGVLVADVIGTSARVGVSLKQIPAIVAPGHAAGGRAAFRN